MRIFTITIMLLSALCCLAKSDREVMTEATKAYNDSDYVKCIGLYQNLLKQKGGDSELYYNLGNAYTCLENYGSAVLNYRKSLKLNPLNRDASRNLAYVEQIVSLANERMVEDRNLDPTPEKPSFFTKVRGVLESPGSNFWAWISGICFVTVCGATAVYLFSSVTKMKKMGFFLALGALLVSVGAYVLSCSSRRSALSVSECVLMVPQSILKEQPSEKAKDVAVPLHGGTTFRILTFDKDSTNCRWVRVWLNDEFTGWIPEENVEVVRI